MRLGMIHLVTLKLKNFNFFNSDLFGNQQSEPNSREGMTEVLYTRSIETSICRNSVNKTFI